MSGPWDFSVSPSLNWTLGFWTIFVLELGLGLGDWTLDNSISRVPREGSYNKTISIVTHQRFL